MRRFAPQLDFVRARLSRSTDVGLRLTLAAKGIPVLGVNSLAYFRKERTPTEAKKLINDVTSRALMLHGAQRVVLIGHSFGADQLQAALPAMPQMLREKVPLVVLLVLLDTNAYRATPAEIFSNGISDLPALPTARQLTWTQVMCIHGAEEAKSLCPLLQMPYVERVTLPGGHLLNRDLKRVFAAILQEIELAGKR